jgi:hypothetical protein
MLGGGHQRRLALADRIRLAARIGRVTLRGFLLAGAAAILPSAGAGLLAEVPGQTALAEFSPPNVPIVLTRTVYRTLVDGKELVVSRRYAIRFSRLSDGFRLDGELIDAQVSAPPSLAALADIERKRVDNGLFPALLDQHGLIRSGLIGAVDAQTRLTAVDRAKTTIGGSKLPTSSKRTLDTLTGQVANSSHGTSWPVFLFNPGAAEHFEARKVALPDGSEGEVEVRVRAEGRLVGSLPKLVERRVTTRLAGTTRTSREVWTLSL